MPVLDEFDLRLIRELEIDARQSTYELGKKLGKSNTTVGRRLKRLLDGGVIRICAIPSAIALGFKTRARIRINTPSEKAKAVADLLASYSNVRSSILTTGKYNVCLWTIFRNDHELIRFVDEQLAGVPNVTGVDVDVTLEWSKFRWSYLATSIYPKREAIPRDLDESELSLIKELELNPRKSVSSLSRELGIARPTLQRKLQTLQKENIITIACVANPQALGFETMAIIDIQVTPGKVRATINAFIKESYIMNIAIMSGRCNITMSVSFHNWSEMSHFITHRLSAMPGVTNIEPVIILGARKTSYSLLS